MAEKCESKYAGVTGASETNIQESCIPGQMLQLKDATFNLDHSEADANHQNILLQDDAGEDSEVVGGKSNASNLQTFWNIFNANQGVVLLSMPFVVLYGTYLGVVATALVAIISNFTNKELVRCLYTRDPETGIKVRVRNSYEEIGEDFAGSFGKWMVYLTLVAEQLSYCTGILILCGSILHSSFPQVGLEKTHWSMLAFLLVIPSTYARDLVQVSWVSLVAVVIGQVICATVAAYSLSKADTWTVREAPPFNISRFFVSMGIVVVSFSSQPYMPAIEGSMQNKMRFDQVANITYVIITFLRVAFGLISYWTFKSDTQQVITNNLPQGPFKITVNIVALVLGLLSFTFPAFTVFVLIDKVEVSCTRRRLKSRYRMLKLQTPEAGAKRDHFNQTLASDDENDVKRETTAVLSNLKRACMRLVPIAAALSVALIVPHFGLYMGFVGNFTGICLCFIFPCLFNMKLRRSGLSKWHFFLHTTIVILGSLSAGAGIYYSTKELIDAYSSID